MRPTSSGHELEAAGLIPQMNGAQSWELPDGNREHHSGTQGVDDMVHTRNGSSRSAEAYRRLAGTPERSSQHFAAPWTSESDTNIWGRGPSRPISRQSADYPRNPPLDQRLDNRRLSLDSLGPLQAIWDQNDQRASHKQGPLSNHVPMHGREISPELEHSFGQLNLQASPYPSGFPNQGFNGVSLENAQRLAQMNGSWDEQAVSRQAMLNGASYASDHFAQAHPTELSHRNLQPHYAGMQQPVYMGQHLNPVPQQMGTQETPPAKLNHAARVSLLDGLSQADLRIALQHPQTARYIKQLEMEALWAAKAQQQPKSLEERLSAARQVAQGMQNLHRNPPPPPPRLARPALPPPLDTATVQRYLAQTGLSTVNKAPKTSPRNGKERSRLLGSKPKISMDALNASLEALVESLKPSEEDVEQQGLAFTQVSDILKKNFAHAKVHQFGSTANSLSICGNNDMDICLEMFEPDNGQPYKGPVVEQIGHLVTEANMASVIALPNARVPVVKFVVPETATKVDVTVNNMLALSNTRLLRDYAAVDPRLMKLVFIVKHWAKRRQVNDSYRGTLSSYCYVLMCIHFLQNREPPILPSLQSIQPPTYIRTVSHWKCDYYDKPLPDFGKENKDTLAELVWKFFEFWAWAHDFNNSVVSVRTGKFLTKAQKDWTRRVGNERHLICIEDPFETSHDLGRTVDRQTSGILHKEFDRAACILRDEEDPFAQLFDPYRAGKAD